jgi:hypothetical protein
VDAFRVKGYGDVDGVIDDEHCSGASAELLHRGSPVKKLPPLERLGSILHHAGTSPERLPQTLEQVGLIQTIIRYQVQSFRSKSRQTLGSTLAHTNLVRMDANQPDATIGAFPEPSTVSVEIVM